MMGLHGAPGDKSELVARFPILAFFACDHLPLHLHRVSKPFQVLAFTAAEATTDHPAELAAGLRKLLEAKDCMVRAALARSVGP